MRSDWLQNPYSRGTAASRPWYLRVPWEGSGDVPSCTLGIRTGTGDPECSGLLVDGWGILYPLGAVSELLARLRASAVVWNLGFGRLWLALSSLSIVWCKQHRDAVGCHFVALSANFLLRFALKLCFMS